MAEPPAPALAVVLATRNRLPLLTQALAALLGKIEAPHEIVVMDLGSDDGTREYLQGLAGIRLVCNDQPRGQAADLNPIFASLAARYTCWLSDDNVAVPGMLDAAVAILDQHPDIGMVALKVKDVTGRRQDEPYIGGIWPTGVLNCNQGVIRSALFREIGYFDEAYRSYGIDPDVTTRVLLSGAKVVFTREVAVHHYRDHAAAPGAMQERERARQRQAARDLYARKFARLAWQRPLWQRLTRGGIWRGLIRPLYALGRRLNLPLEAWLGLNERDWANLLYARYISPLDFFRNRGRAYYLVQHMPLRQRSA